MPVRSWSSGTIAEDVWTTPIIPTPWASSAPSRSLDETAERLKPIAGPDAGPHGAAGGLRLRIPAAPTATGACRTRKPEMTGVGGTQMVRCLAHQGVFESTELMEEVRHGR